MKRTLILLAVLLTATSAPFVRAESAQPLTDEYIRAIKVGCSNALQGMLQVQKTEAATRVNRGREYESLLRLVAAFNSRVVLNKLDAPTLTSTAAKMQTRFTSFQQHYLTYADRVDETLRINCKDAPVTFYDSLTATREARAAVANDVSEMDKLLEEYHKGFEELRIVLANSEAGARQ